MDFRSALSIRNINDLKFGKVTVQRVAGTRVNISDEVDNWNDDIVSINDPDLVIQPMKSTTSHKRKGADIIIDEKGATKRHMDKLARDGHMQRFVAVDKSSGINEDDDDTRENEEPLKRRTKRMPEITCNDTILNKPPFKPITSSQSQSSGHDIASTSVKAVGNINLPISATHPNPVSQEQQETTVNAIESNNAIQLPQFSNMDAIIHVDNDDAVSQWNYLRKIVPSNLAGELGKLSEVEIRRLRIQAASYNLSLFTDEMERFNNMKERLVYEMSINHKLTEENVMQRNEMAELKETSNTEIRRLKEYEKEAQELRLVNKKLKEEADNMRNEMSKMENKLRLADEAKLKAEADVRTVRDLAAEYCQELETVNKELADQQAVCEYALYAKQDAEASRFRAEEEKNKWRTAIPKIFYDAIKSDAVMAPFTRLLKAAQSVGNLELYYKMCEEIELPDPLPDSIQVMVDEQKCKQEWTDASKVLEDIKVPFIDQFGGPICENLDKILKM